MKMDPKLLPMVLAVQDFPDHTVLVSDGTILINVEGASPDWVIELNQTKAGKVLLRRVLAGLLLKQDEKERKERGHDSSQGAGV